MKPAPLVLVAALAAAGCSHDDPAGAPARSRRHLQFPVEVQAVSARPVSYSISATGSVDAFERIQITARVAGAVEKVSFREGEQVKAGAVLVEIEPARFKLAADAARAALAKASSARADAESALARREQANREHPGLIPAEELETFRTRAQAAGADAEAERVALARARLDLHDAYVRAPRAGIIQSRTVETGQYVQPGTVMATLIDRDPLLCRFQVAEADARRIAPGGPISFRVADDHHAYSAVIVHVAESADPASRMVAVTAEVKDPARDHLNPGAFAEITVPVGGSATPAPVIPQTAVRPSERGFLAYVVDGGMAHERVLTLGLRTADGQVEVRSGLEPGEQLVVRGAEALSDGAPVRIVPPGGSKPAAARAAPGRSGQAGHAP